MVPEKSLTNGHEKLRFIPPSRVNNRTWRSSHKEGTCIPDHEPSGDELDRLQKISIMQEKRVRARLSVDGKDWRARTGIPVLLLKTPCDVMLVFKSCPES